MRHVTHRRWTGKGEFVEAASVFRAGRRFTAGGAAVQGGRAVGYLKKNTDGTWSLTGWGSGKLGPCQITATWRTPRSYVSSTMVQAECKIDGVWYTGRGAGDGMLWQGKRKKG